MSGELYKKHRPRSLDRVIGNQDTVEALQTMVEKGTIPHSILFSGPSGCGKTTLARILSRDQMKCGEMDLAELNCSSFRGIDTIREIQRAMGLSPVAGDSRVWILDEFQMMSKDGQNAALKMLEDTPDHVYFLICTTDPGKLIPAILTRCTHMKVKPLIPEDVEKLVLRVCKKEGIDISQEVIDEIAVVSRGSPRSALVSLDKIRNIKNPDQQIAALSVSSDEEAQAIDLCRALIRKEQWVKVAALLKKIKTDPEQIRWAVLGYARSVLLSGAKGGGGAYTVICAFENHFYDSKDAGLARACYEAIHG